MLSPAERQKNYRNRAKLRNLGGFRTTERRHNLKRYGITVAKYDEMLAAQDGKCAICGTVKPGGRSGVKHFAVDHCHLTKAVRGLLCIGCNHGLGSFAESPEALRSAVHYLGRAS